jgi:hypothetical protein
MRLRVAGLLLASALAAEQLGFRVDVYDDGLVHAVMPTLSGSVVGERWSADGGFTMDALSGATRTLAPDAWSGATQFSDQREAGQLAVSRLGERGTLSLSGSRSVESDYAGHNLALGASVPFVDDRGTLALTAGGGLGLNTAEGANSRDRQGLLDADVSWIVSARAVVGLTLSGQLWSCDEPLGCHASPYRYILAFEGDQPALVLGEQHPARRSRGAVGLRFSRSVLPIAALHATGRVYADDWGVLGATASITPAVALLGDRLVLRPTVRMSRQTGASFYTPTVQTEGDGVPAWRTGDRELQPSNNLTTGLAARWSWYAPSFELGLDLRAQRTAFHYADAADRQGWLVGGGIDASF